MTSPPNDLLTALKPVVDVLQELGVRHYVGGSVASSTFGVARSTLDVDLVADLKLGHVDDFVQAIQNTYYVNRSTVLDAVTRHVCFNVIHLATSFKVDVFALKQREYDRIAMERAEETDLIVEAPGQLFFVCTPEDIILSKLEWFRLGDEISEKQWNDILGVLKLQGRGLDQDYLTKWAAELGVADLLEKALGEAEPFWGETPF